MQRCQKLTKLIMDLACNIFAIFFSHSLEVSGKFSYRCVTHPEFLLYQNPCLGLLILQPASQVIPDYIDQILLLWQQKEPIPAIKQFYPATCLAVDGDLFLQFMLVISGAWIGYKFLAIQFDLDAGKMRKLHCRDEFSRDCAAHFLQR